MVFTSILKKLKIHLMTSTVQPFPSNRYIFESPTTHSYHSGVVSAVRCGWIHGYLRFGL